MDKYFKVPTDGSLNKFALTPSELIISCWMMNLINLNFRRMSYSFVRNGIENQCGIKYDIRTIKTIIASIIRKGVLTRTKVQNSYAYQNSDLNVPENIQSDHYQTDHPQSDHHQNDHHNSDQNVPNNSDLNVPENIQSDHYQTDHPQSDHHQNDHHNSDQNVPNNSDLNVPENIQSDHPINISNKEEKEEEERTPVTSVIPVSAIKFDFDYQSLQDIPNLEDRAHKIYEEAYKVFPREIIRAQEVSVCVEEMSLCYELNAREFERSKPNFKDTAKERAGLIVQALLADKSKFAPIEILWGINRYKTTNTAEPTPATVKRECIKSRVENKGYNNELQYLIRLRRDEQRICSKNANDFLCRFADRYASELEGLLNAYYAESKDYDVKFNELVLKMAEMPPIQESIPNYWNIYQNKFRELPINLDIRMIA